MVAPTVMDYDVVAMPLVFMRILLWHLVNQVLQQLTATGYWCIKDINSVHIYVHAYTGSSFTKEIEIYEFFAYTYFYLQTAGAISFKFSMEAIGR